MLKYGMDFQLLGVCSDVHETSLWFSKKDLKHVFALRSDLPREPCVSDQLNQVQD